MSKFPDDACGERSEVLKNTSEKKRKAECLDKDTERAKRLLRSVGVVITGGASGIGLAAAESLLQMKFNEIESIHIILADINEEVGQREAKRLQQKCDGQLQRVHYFRVDVSSEDSIRSLISSAAELFEANQASFLYLVNSAGCDFTVDRKRATAVPQDGLSLGEQFDRAVAVNLRSVYLMCEYSRDHLALASQRTSGQQSASIVNISSIQSCKSFFASDPMDASYAAYAATKGGINSFTISSSVPYARHGIRINAVCPGETNTNLGVNTFLLEGIGGIPANQPQTAELLAAQEPEIIGDAAAKLLLMRGTTGVCLTVDGGCSCVGNDGSLSNIVPDNQ